MIGGGVVSSDHVWPEHISVITIAIKKGPCNPKREKKKHSYVYSLEGCQQPTSSGLHWTSRKWNCSDNTGEGI
jgi:hypothetical protein